MDHRAPPAATGGRPRFWVIADLFKKTHDYIFSSDLEVVETGGGSLDRNRSDDVRHEGFQFTTYSVRRIPGLKKYVMV